MRRWAIGIGVGGLLGWLGTALGLHEYGSEGPIEGHWDLLIVAGCRVEPDGSPSLALKRRVRRAVDLWRVGHAERVVFTGGVGTWGGSEAGAASEYAATLGLPREAMLLEERSTSTEENAAFAAELYPAERVLVVSDTYHVFRVERVFGRHYPHADGAGSTPTPWFLVRGSLREVAAVGAYAVQGRL